MEAQPLDACTPYSAPYYGQYRIFMYAILLYRQFFIFMQPYITIYYYLVSSISCFFLMLINPEYEKILEMDKL